MKPSVFEWKMNSMILFMVVALLFSICMMLSEEAEGKNITVDDSGGANYETIQKAIDAADEGDTIRVWEGTYHENVVVNKSVTLVGNGSAVTVIDGGGNGSVANITANWVNISGFMLTMSGEDPDDAGIRIESDNNTVINNTYTENNNGIWSKDTSHNTFTNNTCTDNNYGIRLDSSNNWTLENNTCSSNDIFGIFLLSSGYITIANNTSSNNAHGIYIGSSSDHNTLKNNTCSSNNGYGIWLQMSNKNKIIRNICSSNDVYGFRLISTNNSTIANNTCTSNNVHGISIEGSNDCTITNNTCSSNGANGLNLQSLNRCIIVYNVCSNNNEIYSGIMLSHSGATTIESNMCSNNGRGILVVSSSGCTIEDNTCFSNNAEGISLSSNSCMIIHNTCEENYYGISVDDSNSCTIEDNLVSFSNDNGISLYSSSNCTIENNTCSNNKNGIYVGTYSNYNTLNSNTCSSNNENGIYFPSTIGSTITNNTCSDNQYGILLDSSINITILNNTCPINEYGIRLDLSENSTITNNICSNNGYGIILSSSKNSTITYNICTWNSAKAIFLEFSNNCQISHNTCSSTNAGIDLQDTGDCFLDSNICLNNDRCIRLYRTRDCSITNNIGSSSNYGISSSNSDNTTIANNNCSSNNHRGISLSSSKNCTITNNTCSSNTDDGIFVQGIIDTIISNNTCSNNDNGIRLNSNDGMVMNNVCTNNNYGISILDDSSDCIITNNTCTSNGFGIQLDTSSDITITNNIFSSNYYAIDLSSSITCTLMNNTMLENGISISGVSPEHWTSHFMGITNTVNGKPVFYYVNESEISVPADAGQAIIANCSGMNIENINCNNGTTGISVGFSSDITISYSTANRNMVYGIYVAYSDNITIAKSNFSSNLNRGVMVEYSDNVSLSNSNISMNRDGIYIMSSTGAITAHYNNIYDNLYYGIRAVGENKKTINACNNYWGAPSGPYHIQDNQDGGGDKVTDRVGFDPWLEYYYGLDYSFSISNATTHPILPSQSTTFSLNITNTGLANDSYFIEASFPINWFAYAIPNIITIPSNLTDVVNITVQSPEYPPAGFIAQINITVHSTGNPDFKESVEFHAIVQQKYECEISIVSAEEWETGAENHMTFNISNLGNGQDNITISLVSLPEHWQTSSYTTILSLPGFSSDSWEYRITPSVNSKTGIYHINFTIESDGGPIWQVDVVIELMPSYGISWSGFTEKAALPGGTVEYGITLLNEGNTDDLAIIFAENAEPSIEIIPISWAGTISFDVAVQIPEIAYPGDVIISNITIIYGGHGQLTIQLNTSVQEMIGISIVMDEILSIELGISASVDVTIINSGNGPANLSLDHFPVEGIDLEFSQGGNIIIPAFSQANVSVYITVSYEKQYADKDFNVTLQLEHQDGKFFGETIHVQASLVYHEISIGDGGLIIYVDGTNNYPIKVRNNGTVPETIILTDISPEGWDASFTPASLVIYPNSTTVSSLYVRRTNDNVSMIDPAILIQAHLVDTAGIGITTIILIENNGPEADLRTSDGMGCIMFDGTYSHDPDGYEVEYVWEIDGFNFSGPFVTYSFPEPGVYYVRLIVTDNLGKTDVKEKNLTVQKEQTLEALESESDDGETTSLRIAFLVLLGWIILFTMFALFFWKMKEREIALLNKVKDMESRSREVQETTGKPSNDEWKPGNRIEVEPVHSREKKPGIEEQIHTVEDSDEHDDPTNENHDQN